MPIRAAKAGDLPAILHIFALARQRMRAAGNPTQWGNSYPPQALLEEDTEKGWCYVLTDSTGKVHGVFVLATEPDPSYQEITGGQWLNDGPYGTIHRVASDGVMTGVFSQIIDFCSQRWDSLRIDTHRDNHIMRHLIVKNGFTYCGVIRLVHGGGERLAYQRLTAAAPAQP